MKPGCKSFCALTERSKPSLPFPNVEQKKLGKSTSQHGGLNDFFELLLPGHFLTYIEYLSCPN